MPLEEIHSPLKLHWIWIAIAAALLATTGKSTIVIREKCLPQKILTDNSCSASNPSSATTKTESIQVPCHCNVGACENYSVQKVVSSCRSGFVHANKCGACVRCAKDLDEACGGYADHLGTCRQGLVCEISETKVLKSEKKDLFENKDDLGEGKCVVDAPEKEKSGKVYRSPKATFAIEDLLGVCQKTNLTKNVEEGKELREEETNKSESTKALRSLKGSSKVQNVETKLSSVERGWKEVFEDREPAKSENQEEVLFPAAVQPEMSIPGRSLVPAHLLRSALLPYSQPQPWEGSELNVGEMLKSFNSLEEAKAYMRAKGLEYSMASGKIRTRITNLQKGEAVVNPLKKLKQLGSMPEIKSGTVKAGNLNGFPILNRLPRSIPEDSERGFGSSVQGSSSAYIKPQSSLLLGKGISFFNDLEEARRNIDPEIFRNAERVSGQEVSRNIETGIAVSNPSKVLKSLRSRPKIVEGKVVAGKPSKLQVLNF